MPLRLRREQVRAIELELHPEQRPAYLAHLRRSFPERLRTLSDDELRERMEALLQRARGLGLHRPADDLRLLNLAVCFGWSLDRDVPWVEPMLRDASVSSSSERLRRVKARFVRQLQLQARNAEARRAFGPID
ncbi:MAG: hypothetical protein H6712_18870 [Myxococcales bacterium]|nr:hypothetical protein [Myxococcales bacterium]MCB9715938.1 hypothetical protein [Myxococcales bacterium]